MALALNLTPQQRAQLLGHLDLISKWNKVYNLTAVRDPGEMLTHHLLDSLSVVTPLARLLVKMRDGEAVVGEPTDSTASSNASLKFGADTAPHVLDVGAGAGLPGVTLAIALPAEMRVQVTCVDAVAKKAGFIQQVAAELGLASLRASHGRIEALRLPAADVITCRAFASLADIVALTERHLAPHGVWMAMKGVVPQEEIEQLPAGVEVFHVEPLVVPFLEAQRCIVWMRRSAKVKRS